MPSVFLEYSPCLARTYLLVDVSRIRYGAKNSGHCKFRFTHLPVESRGRRSSHGATFNALASLSSVTNWTARTPRSIADTCVRSIAASSASCSCVMLRSCLRTRTFVASVSSELCSCGAIGLAFRFGMPEDSHLAGILSAYTY